MQRIIMSQLQDFNDNKKEASYDASTRREVTQTSGPKILKKKE